VGNYGCIDNTSVLLCEHLSFLTSWLTVWNSVPLWEYGWGGDLACRRACVCICPCRCPLNATFQLTNWFLLNIVQILYHWRNSIAIVFNTCVLASIWCMGLCMMLATVQVCIQALLWKRVFSVCVTLVEYFCEGILQLFYVIQVWFCVMSVWAELLPLHNIQTKMAYTHTTSLNTAAFSLISQSH
jgi:hypothetical protein